MTNEAVLSKPRRWPPGPPPAWRQSVKFHPMRWEFSFSSSSLGVKEPPDLDPLTRTVLNFTLIFLSSHRFPLWLTVRMVDRRLSTRLFDKQGDWVKRNHKSAGWACWGWEAVALPQRFVVYSIIIEEPQSASTDVWCAGMVMLDDADTENMTEMMYEPCTCCTGFGLDVLDLHLLMHTAKRILGSLTAPHWNHIRR